MVATESGGLITIAVNTFAVCCGTDESVTWIPTLNDPVAVGVPAIAPVEAFRERPGGKLPEATLHV